MEGEKEMSFQEFDSSEIERCKENMQRKPKNAGAIPRPGRRVKTHGRLPQRGMGGSDEGKRFHHAGFAQSRELAPESEEVQALVAKWQDFISARYYTCTDEILEGLGQMYTADERFTENIDRFGEGTAEQMSKAIACYVSRRKTTDK